MIAEIARLKGYRNVGEMLRILYIEKGLSVTASAKAIGCSYSTVRRLLRKHNLKIRSKGGPNHCLSVEVSEADLKTMTLREICEKYGISLSTAFRLRKKAKKNLS